MKNTIELEPKEISKSIIVTVSASKAIRSLRWRLPLAAPFFHLGRWIAGCQLEVSYDGEKHVQTCPHPGCCCVCGHTGKCPEDGPSIVEGVES